MLKFYLIEVIRIGKPEWFPVIVVIGPTLRELLPMLEGYTDMAGRIEDFRVRTVEPLEIAQLPKHVVIAAQREGGFNSV